MPKIEIDELRCKGCGLCTIACPKKLIALSEQINNHGYTPAVFQETGIECTGCALCAEMCPDVAIKVFK
ncbi:MAG: ferredoxin family protein [Deltaproteobacteria bacterium]|nr:ferredoxin family protein [Deltaproteobacteria bacterium]